MHVHSVCFKFVRLQLILIRVVEVTTFVKKRPQTTLIMKETIEITVTTSCI